MRIDVLETVWTKSIKGHRLGLQWCRYPFKGGEQYGYRFMWYDEAKRRLKTDRGQARIPSAAIMFELIQRATKAGWFVDVERRTK